MKVTTRQWQGFLKAHREWIGDNDAYNKQHFGITKAQYYIILKAVSSLRGIAGDTPSLAAVNREIATGRDYMTGRKFVD